VQGCCEGDCCAHTCCFGLSHCCAQCQEVREIEFRKHALNTSQRQAQQAAAPPAPYGQPGQADPYAQQYAYAQPSSPNGTQGPVSITINHTNSGSREMQSHGSGFQPQLLPTNAQLVRLASGQVVMVSPVTEMPHMGGANMQNVQMGQILELPQVSADNSAVVPPQEQFIRK